jgi:uncharacterized protein (DUF362 family)
MASSTVSVVKSSYSDVRENLAKAISLAGGFHASNLGDKEKVVIKVNLCDARTPDTGTVTHPVFLDAF